MVTKGNFRSAHVFFPSYFYFFKILLYCLLKCKTVSFWFYWSYNACFVHFHPNLIFCACQLPPYSDIFLRTLQADSFLCRKKRCYRIVNWPRFKSYIYTCSACTKHHITQEKNKVLVAQDLEIVPKTHPIRQKSLNYSTTNSSCNPTGQGWKSSKNKYISPFGIWVFWCLIKRKG